MLKNKLRNWLSSRWDYEIQCDVFEGLDAQELSKLASTYNINPSLGRLGICRELSVILENKKNEYKKILKEEKCSNTMDPISGTDVADIDSRELITIDQNGQLYCFEIEGIYTNVFVNKNEKNPYTNVPFDEAIKNQIQERYKLFKSLKGNKFDADRYNTDSSLTAWISQLSNYIPYMNNIQDMATMSKKEVQIFIEKLEENGVYLNLDFSENILLKEQKIILIRKLIKWVINNDYINVRQAMLQFFSHKLISYAQNGDLEKIKFIIESSDVEGFLLDYAIIDSAENGHLEVVKYLHRAGGDIHAEENFAFKISIDKGHLDVVKYLYEAGSVIDGQAVMLAIKNNNKGGVLGYLIQTGVSRNRALKYALDKDNTEIAKYLVGLGANIKTVLEYSVKTNNIELFLYLLPLSKRADLESLWVYAITNDRLEIFKHLEKSFSLQQKNEAFIVAAYTGQLDIVKHLVESGEVDIHAEDDVALNLSAKFGKLDVVKYLVEKGSISNEALINATRNGHSDIAQYLIDTGKVDIGYAAVSAYNKLKE